MRNLKFILLVVLQFIGVIGCVAPKIIIHGTQEYISLKLLNEDRYRYLHYNLSDTGFNYDYNIGRYVKKGNTYDLYPDSITYDNYSTDVSRKRLENGKSFRIHISTDITGDYLSQYTIHLLLESSDFVFHNTSVDTVITNLSLKQLKVKVDLATKFKKGLGKQMPTYTSFTSKIIPVNSDENDISIHIPVSFSTYFYKYQPKIELRDIGLFWEEDGRKIQMRNVDF